MENSTAPSEPGTREKVRSPLKRPSGMPPVQTIFLLGTNSLTLTGKARPGLIFAYTVTFSPGAIFPSTLSTVGFQDGQAGASVNSFQITSGAALIFVLTEKAFI